MAVAQLIQLHLANMLFTTILRKGSETVPYCGETVVLSAKGGILPSTVLPST